MRFMREQAGLSGLETALVVLAFVVTSCLFGLVAIKAGSVHGRSGPAVQAKTVTETAPVLKLKGMVLGFRTGDGKREPYYLNTVKFVLESRGSHPVDMAQDSVLVSYRDDDQLLRELPWSIYWLRGEGALLEPKELAEITIYSSQISPRVGSARTFTITIKPLTGPTLEIVLSTPLSLSRVTELQAWAR